MWTTYRILRLKRAEHEADADFGVVLYWLGQLRNCRTYANCRALSSSRSKKPEVIDGRAHFVYPGMCWTQWSQTENNAAGGDGKTIGIHAHHECVIYHMSLLVLFRAKQWLSAAEQVPDLAQSAATPKTLGQLRRALEDPLVAPHLPFAADFEDEAG